MPPSPPPAGPVSPAGPPILGPVLTLTFDQEVAVIGDIHGRIDLLQPLVEALPGDMPLLVAGDIGDRGPATRACVDLLLERGALGVRGNHEEWFIAWACGAGFESAALSPGMGGRATLDSYGVVGRSPSAIEAEHWRVPDAHLQWLAGLAVACDLTVMGRPYWIVHAGVPPGADRAPVPRAHVVPTLAAVDPASLLWRKTAPERVPALDRPIIMGHVPRREPVDLGHVIAIDTGAGAFPDGALTAVVLPSRRFVTAR